MCRRYDIVLVANIKKGATSIGLLRVIVSCSTKSGDTTLGVTENCGDVDKNIGRYSGLQLDTREPIIIKQTACFSETDREIVFGYTLQ